MNGLGVLKLSDGSNYFGEFKMDVFHGEGRFEHADGRIYEGHWENNVMHGYGKCSWPDGTRYIGSWKNGRKHFKCRKGQLNVNIEDASKLEDDNFDIIEEFGKNQYKK
jgi:hypothetical protein